MIDNFKKQLLKFAKTNMEKYEFDVDLRLVQSVWQLQSKLKFFILKNSVTWKIQKELRQVKALD